jgi:hypothetical protein
MKLTEIEIEIREMDPDFEEKIKTREKTQYGLNKADNYIELSVDRIRGPEVFF